MNVCFFQLYSFIYIRLQFQHAIDGIAGSIIMIPIPQLYIYIYIYIYG